LFSQRAGHYNTDALFVTKRAFQYSSCEWENSMTAEIPLDLVPFVQRMVAAKRFLNEGDVLAEGLRLLCAAETLRDEVRKGFEQLDAGHGVSAAEVSARVEQRIRDIESGIL
jgi:Arc/MetJ-type ribon-helix-helix transcriptional regulator